MGPQSFKNVRSVTSSCRTYLHSAFLYAMIRLRSHFIKVYLVFISINIINTVRSEEVDNDTFQERNGRFFSMFEVIKFPNTNCTGDTKVGTCYTSAECEDKDGTKDGTCADGFGTCCIFEVEAGAIITENNTYFKSSGKETSGTKEVRVCPGDNICQLRLDLISFVINGPYTSTETDGLLTSMLYGVPNNDNTKGADAMSQ